MLSSTNPDIFFISTSKYAKINHVIMVAHNYNKIMFKLFTIQKVMYSLAIKWCKLYCYQEIIES
jgi:hypothetical protein